MYVAVGVYTRDWHPQLLLLLQSLCFLFGVYIGEGLWLDRQRNFTERHHSSRITSAVDVKPTNREG